MRLTLIYPFGILLTKFLYISKQTFQVFSIQVLSFQKSVLEGDVKLRLRINFVSVNLNLALTTMFDK